MAFFSWIDNRTLLACHCILIVVFAVMMLGLRSLYPGLCGITSIAIGFLFGIPGVLLLTAQGRISSLFSVVGGALCVFLASIFLYRGILQFGCEQVKRSRLVGEGRAGARKPPADMTGLLYGAAAVALAVVIYFTQVDCRLAPCVIAVSATMALARGLMAWALFRSAAGRAPILLFAGSMGVYSLLNVGRVVAEIVHPSVHKFMAFDGPQTFTLLMSLVFLCVQGVFYLMMFAGDVAESVHEQAQLDYLSGTLNRRGIEDALRGEVARTRRTGESFAVMLIDLDHFKSINDRYGHAAGDESLRRVARSIATTVRVYDRLGRYGGDEFLLLLPQSSGDDAMVTSSRILDGIREETGRAEAVPVTVSIGVTYCTSAEEIGTILSRADAAMYEAKRDGRDCARLNLNFPAKGEGGGVPLLQGSLLNPMAAVPREI